MAKETSEMSQQYTYSFEGETNVLFGCELQEHRSRSKPTYSGGTSGAGAILESSYLSRHIPVADQKPITAIK